MPRTCQLRYVCNYKSSMNMGSKWTVLGYLVKSGDQKGGVMNWKFNGNEMTCLGSASYAANW